MTYPTVTRSHLRRSVDGKAKTPVTCTCGKGDPFTYRTERHQDGRETALVTFTCGCQVTFLIVPAKRTRGKSPRR